jgi:hypothetical protein
MLSYNTSVQNSIFMKRRNQNQKFSFPFFAGSPHTPRRKRNCKEIFGFGIATEGSVRGASVIRQNPADFVRNTFELRPIHTAMTDENWLIQFESVVIAWEKAMRRPEATKVAEAG